MVSHTKALHIALKTYSAMVELATSTNQRDQEYNIRRSMPKASNPRNRAQLAQVVICSILTHYISPMKRCEVSVPFNFALEESPTSFYSFSCRWTESTHETQNHRMVKIGRYPQRSSCLILLLKQGLLQQIVQDHVQTCVDSGKSFC